MKYNYIPEQTILSSVPNPDTDYIKMYRKDDGFWYEVDSAGVETLINNDYPRYFQALKTTNQATTTAFSTVINWDTPTIIDSIYSFDALTGVLTINSTGLFEFSAFLLGDLIQSNRSELAVKLQENNVDVTGALDRQYAMRNNAQDEGSTQFNNFLLEVTTSGNTYRIQEQRIGATANITLARFTVKKLRN